MGLIKKIKELEDKLNINNNPRMDYKFNKIVFNIMVLLMVIFTLFIWAEYDFTNISNPNIFLECELPNAICSNRLYILCNPNSIDYFGGVKACEKIDPVMYEREFLYGGETLGQRPSFFSENAIHFFVIIIILAFGINHWLNKRGKRNV